MRDAYRQLTAFQESREWALPEKYALLSELLYKEALTRSKKRIMVQLDSELLRMARSKLQEQKGLPIGFTACTKTDIYLIFRGTMTTRELLRDFSINLSRYPYAALGKVHDGFVQVYDKFRPAILDSLSRAGSGKRLFIAGHSLGAALATLAAPDICLSTAFTSPVVYTYGSPRVGDRGVRRRIQSSLQRALFPHRQYLRPRCLDAISGSLPQLSWWILYACR